MDTLKSCYSVGNQGEESVVVLFLEAHHSTMHATYPYLSSGTQGVQCHSLQSDSLEGEVKKRNVSFRTEFEVQPVFSLVLLCRCLMEVS